MPHLSTIIKLIGNAQEYLIYIIDFLLLFYLYIKLYTLALTCNLIHTNKCILKNRKHNYSKKEKILSQFWDNRKKKKKKIQHDSFMYKL